MHDSIICPHCSKPIPLTQAITQQIDEKYKNELETLKKESEQEKERFIALAKKRIEEERLKATKEAEIGLRAKIAEEMELKVKNTQNESEELKKQKKLLQDQLLEMNSSIRKLQNDNKEKELEMMKRFNVEQEKFREEQEKKLSEQFKFQILEKEKKLQDAIKANEDLRRKLEQGSQQMQGEVLELALEEMLHKEFPFDEIQPVPKGINGADIIQVVKNSGGARCGVIIWETKRTKSWSHSWIPKLKDDQRSVKAEIAVLVSDVIPESITHFGLNDGVWVCKFEYILGIAYALRSQLSEIALVKSSMVGQQSKMELLYSYVTSIEFKHRVEAILEAFTNMQDEIEKERRWFAQKWAREEKNLRKVLDTTIGMNGDLQSIMGKAISDVESTEMLTEATETLF